MRDRRIRSTLKWGKIRFQVLHSGESTAAWWRIVARNGKILAHSENYVRIGNARRGLTTLLYRLGFYAKNAPEPDAPQTETMAVV